MKKKRKFINNQIHLKKKKSIIFLLLFSFILVFLSGCSDDAGQSEKEWTVLVYMACDNSLNKAAIEDMNEMELANFSDELNILVQIDNFLLNEDVDYKGARRYKMTHDENMNEINSPTIMSLGEIDSGDYQTLTNFANWGFSEYPSRNKALIISSHGDSWYNYYHEFCMDHESDNSIVVNEGELKTALKNMRYHLDILLLDACNMQSMEVITECYQYADYIIASEEEINDDGFPYDDLFNCWEELDSIELLSIEIVNKFFESYEPGGSQNLYGDYFPVSCSAVKSSGFEQLLESINSFSTAFNDSAAVVATRDECLEHFISDLLSDIDIKEFFKYLQQYNQNSEYNAQIETIISQIDNVFIAQRFHDYLGEVGTGIVWFPDDSTRYNNFKNYYENLDYSDTEWQKLIELYFYEN